MSRYSGGDPYLDPATGVLRNRLDIADEATLEQMEAAFAATRFYELSRSPVKGSFDLAHLPAIHRYLFQDLYEWAGELRTIDISKGGNPFAQYAHTESAAAAISSSRTGEAPRRARSARGLLRGSASIRAG